MNVPLATFLILFDDMSKYRNVKSGPNVLFDSASILLLCISNDIKRSAPLNASFSTVDNQKRAKEYFRSYFKQRPYMEPSAHNSTQN